MRQQYDVLEFEQVVVNSRLLLINVESGADERSVPQRAARAVWSTTDPRAVLMSSAPV